MPKVKPSTNRRKAESLPRREYSGNRETPLAMDRELIERIQRDIGLIGLVGETDGGLLVYIGYTSRLLNNPMAIVIRGGSGGGKSTAQRTPLQLFPPEDVIDATSLTPNALYRMEAGSLEHKILVTGERKHRNDDDAADANAALRQLLSEGRISRLCPVKDDGKWVTKLIEQAGPVAYSETTTSHSIFSEDLNRMLEIFIDETPEQNRRVMRATARAYCTDTANVDTSVIIDEHREFQKSLEFCAVRIPYAARIADKIPAVKTRSRRVIGQVLATIEAITLLHQFQRERDKEGRLIATADDYAVARRLLMAPLHAAIGVGEKYKKAQKLRTKLPDEFDTNEARTAGGYENKMAVSRALRDLASDGLIVQTAKASSHRPARWRWVENVDSILPAVKDVLQP